MVMMRPHFGSKVKVEIGKGSSEVDSTIGVQQGPCESPVLLNFTIQAAMKALQGPGGGARP
jgi:hypothetical protein